MPQRSIGPPLAIGIVLALLVLVLAIGWQVLVWSDLEPVAPGGTTLDWVLLICGSLVLVLLLVGVVWLCVWLVREVRLNQRQRAFLDAVTHEMKTPLASFRLYLDTLGRHDPPAGQRLEFISRMREDLDRLDGTVDQVLAAARAEEPGRSAQRESVELPGLLGSCIEQICERNRLPADAVQLRANGVPAVRGDSAELSLVFSNLLQNAVKYSLQPVDVTVGVRQIADDRVEIEIRDRGIGIPRRELRKIFQRFYRVGRDVQRKAAGLGLGLFIVRGLVRRQGGQVVARSDGADRGSRFIVTLRAAPPRLS